MDFQCWRLLNPIKIMMINPLIMASRMAVVKILSGTIFGSNQLIDIVLLVYTNEIPIAQQFIQELKACNFPCLNTIVATSDLPRITDAKVFCIYTNFKNPHRLDFDHLDTDEQFDTFYLLIKVAQSLGKSVEELKKPMEKKDKPIIVTDGIVAIDILNTMGKEDMAFGYFCATGLPSTARTILSEYLKVHCNDINLVYMWGANDLEFHIEIEKPFVVYDTISDKKHCDWEMVSSDLLEPLKLDHTQFNASWMKREFIDKMRHMSANTTYGPIYKSWKVNRSLSKVWQTRRTGKKVCISFGIISDGSLRTIKGLPYFLPLVFSEDGSWSVHYRYSELSHVRQEIGRFNKIVKESHDKLVKYCEKFLKENIINQAFVPPDSDDVSISSSTLEQSSLHDV